MLEKILEALVGLTAAVAANTAALAANPTKATKAAKAETTAQTAGAAALNTATPGALAGTSQPAQTAATTSASSAGVTAQQAGACMVDVANRLSRDVAVALLTKYGAATFAGVKPDNYGAFASDAQKALTALGGNPSIADVVEAARPAVLAAALGSFQPAPAGAVGLM